MMNARRCEWVLILLLGGMFVWSGWIKLMGVAEFADSVAGFQLLPPLGISLVAMALPVLELSLGALIFFKGWGRRIGALGMAGLNVLFLVVLGSAWMRGLTVDCGCFGQEWISDPKLKLPVAIARDILLLLGAGWLYLRSWKRHYNRSRSDER